MKCIMEGKENLFPQFCKSQTSPAFSSPATQIWLQPCKTNWVAGCRRASPYSWVSPSAVFVMVKVSRGGWLWPQPLHQPQGGAKMLGYSWGYADNPVADLFYSRKNTGLRSYRQGLNFRLCHLLATSLKQVSCIYLTKTRFTLSG